MTTDTLTAPNELAFLVPARKPPPTKAARTRGVTEIRGPYYSVMGPRYLKDVLDTMGEHIDALKFAGGSFTLMPEPASGARSSRSPTSTTCSVSTCGIPSRSWKLTQGTDAVDRYIEEVARVGFDILEVSGRLHQAFPPTTCCASSSAVLQRAGLKAKPEVGIQFGAGGATTPAELAQEGTRDVGYAIDGRDAAWMPAPT